MAQKKQKIELEFISKGLSEISSKMESLDPSRMGKEGQKALETFQKTAMGLGEQTKIAIEKGASPATIRALNDEFIKLMKNFSKNWTKMLSGAGKDFSSEFELISSNLEEALNKAAELDSKVKETERRFNISPEQDALSPSKKIGEKEIAELGLQEMRAEGQLQEELLSRDSANREASAENLIKLKKQIIDETRNETKEVRDQVDLFIESGKLNKESVRVIKQLIDNKKINLKFEEATARISTLAAAEQKGAALKLIEYKEDLKKREEALKQIEIERQESTKTQIDLNKEAINAGDSAEEIKQNETLAELFEKNTNLLDIALRKKQEDARIEKERAEAVNGTTKAISNQGTTLSKAANQVFNYGLAFSFLRRIYRETLRTIKDLDQAFTEMAIVTTMSRKETWQLADAMSDLARQTGFTTTEIAKLSTFYFRQGRALSEVIEFTRVAAMAARVAGISAADSANFLTSAVNGFGLAADQVLATSDKFAALAAQSASSYEELAVGLSKFAAQANVAGISMDFAMGLLAKGVETTREAPETIGTALKTVLARMRELTDFGKTLEDGMDISRVEGALRQVGIALRDQQGRFRDMEDVITDIGTAWSSYNREQQASIAVALAGTRQQSRLIAVMENFDRTLELVNISQESAGATTAQHVEFMKSLEAATVGLQTAYQEFIRNLTESEIIIGIVRTLTGLLESLTAGLKAFGFAGRNAMVVILGLFVLLKAKGLAIKIISAMTALNTKLLGINTAQIMKQNVGRKQQLILMLKEVKARSILNKVALKNIFTFKGLLTIMKAGTKAIIAKAKAVMFLAAKFLIALGPIGWIIGGVMALVGAIGFFIKRSKRAEERFNKLRDEINASSFEIRRATRNINSFISEIEDLNKLPFLTDEQQKQLEDAGEKIAELVGEENVVRVQGIVDLELSRNLIDAFLQEQDKELAKNMEDLLNNTLKNVKTKDLPESPGARKDITDYYIFQIKEIFGDLSAAEEAEYRRFVDDMLINNPEAIVGFGSSTGRRHTIDRLLGLSGEENLNFIRNQLSSINDETLSFTESFQRFVEVADQSTDEQIDSLKRNFPQFAFLLDQYGSQALQIVKDLEAVGMTLTDELQEGAEILGGQGLKNTISQVSSLAAEYQKTIGVSEETGLSMAWSAIAHTTEDATLKQWMYAQAFKRTNLEFSQDLERIDSKIKNINDTQDKWLSGDITSSELQDFISANADLFQSLEDVENFLAGRRVDFNARAERYREQEMAVARLANSTRILNDAEADTSSAEYRQALVDQVYYRAILQYNGALAQSSVEMQRFNALLSANNRLTSLGIITQEEQTRLLEAQVAAVSALSNQAVDDLAGIRTSFNEMLKDMGIESSFEEMFELIGDEIIPRQDVFAGLALRPDQRSRLLGSVEEVMGEYREITSELFDAFQQMRDDNIKREKEALEKQRKVYQDYFDALDRLEKQRTRRQSREDIVSQLQRLEGATDERSRRKALELRRELNQLDEKTSQETQAEAREALFGSLDTRLEDITNTWNDAALEFTNSIVNAGTTAAGFMRDILAPTGIFDEIDEQGVNFEDLNTNIEDLIHVIEHDLIPDSSSQFEEHPTFSSGIDPMTGAQERAAEALQKAQAKEARIEEIFQERQDRFKGPKWWVDLQKKMNASSDRNFAERQANQEGFSKGGMVDFEGMAMLHGSRSAPEAVLNPSQTEMFIGLRNALEKISFDSNGGGSVNIENISISTASLNNNQDFNRAGETLAEAFRSAIQRKGITVNTNKT